MCVHYIKNQFFVVVGGGVGSTSKPLPPITGKSSVTIPKIQLKPINNFVKLIKTCLRILSLHLIVD